MTKQVLCEAGGIVSAGTPYAADAGAAILREGGTAADAAVGTALALAVSDSANCSFFGRGQFLWRDAEGQVDAVDGTTIVPMAATETSIDGFAGAAIPGLPQALAALHARHGRLPLAQVVEPAIRLAEAGFAPTEKLRAVWAGRLEALSRHPAASTYLGDQGCAPTHFTHPRLASLLRDFARLGGDVLTEQSRATAIADDIRANGGFWQARDLTGNLARTGEVITGRFRDCEVTSIGRQGWGHTLIQMLAILDALPRFGPRLTPDEARRLVLVIRRALEDRPQHLGTLEPRPEGVELARLASAAHAARCADAIVREMAGLPLPIDVDPETLAAPTATLDQDTTHASILDAQGNCVSFTCSIGPHFGQAVTDSTHGVLLARSYQMENCPDPGARDVTEMCPTVVTRDGKLLLALGAAGSERIPGAVMQVIVNVVDRGLPLPQAVAFPRVTLKASTPRVHRHAEAAVIGALHAWGMPPELAGDGHVNHLGIVHAVGFSPAGAPVGAADLAWDGAVRSA